MEEWLNDKKISAQYHVGERDRHCPLVDEGKKNSKVMCIGLLVLLTLVH